jgi:hypothetical protein
MHAKHNMLSFAWGHDSFRACPRCANRAALVSSMPLAILCGTAHTGKRLCGGTKTASDYENMNMLVGCCNNGSHAEDFSLRWGVVWVVWCGARVPAFMQHSIWIHWSCPLVCRDMVFFLECLGSPERMWNVGISREKERADPRAL